MESAKLKEKISKSVKIISSLSEPIIYIAYSGGKDSTAVALLVEESLKIVPRKKIVLIYNETMSEIDLMRKWINNFFNVYKDLIEKYGTKVEFWITRPDPIDTFYWRLFIRGYPAPTFKFRWCTYTLKSKPLRDKIPPDITMLVGLRKDESPRRSFFIKNNTRSLIYGENTINYILDKDRIKKIAPILEWNENDVWSYLELRRKQIKEINRIFKLYWSSDMRYGCWHCTVINMQKALRRNRSYAYYDALRLIYRTISDITELRVPKNIGYSKRGPLKMIARSLLLKAMLKAEELSGIKLYGLDEIKIHNYSLRDILLDLEVRKADYIIKSADPRCKNKFTSVRDLRKYYNFEKYIKIILNKTLKHPSRYFDGYDLILDLLSNLNDL